MSRNSNLFWKIVAYLYNTTVEIQLKMKDIVIPKWLEQTFGKVFIIQIVRLLFSFVLFPSLTKSYNVCFYLISIFMQKKKKIKLHQPNQTNATIKLQQQQLQIQNVIKSDHPPSYHQSTQNATITV